MKITLSKSQWEKIGKKAGWMKISMTEEQLKEQIKKYTPSLILRALQSLQTRGIAGFSTVTGKEVYDVLEICSLKELEEVLDILEEDSLGWIGLS